LPKYGEEAMFAEYNEKSWIKNTFINYDPKSPYPFWCSNKSYKYCKPISKTISFVQFLKNNNCYEEYTFNSKIENQRWSVTSSYSNPEKLKILKPIQWIDFAFNFDFKKETIRFWKTLNKKWLKIIKENSDANIVWGE